MLDSHKEYIKSDSDQADELLYEIDQAIKRLGTLKRSKEQHKIALELLSDGILTLTGLTGRERDAVHYLRTQGGYVSSANAAIALGVSPTRASTILRELAYKGYLTTRRVRRFVMYRINKDIHTHAANS